MANESRTMVSGDRVECRVHDLNTWHKAKVLNVRDSDFDALFNEPVPPYNVSMGLFHKHHEGTNWRYDPDPPPEEPAVEPELAKSEEDPPSDGVS